MIESILTLLVSTTVMVSTTLGLPGTEPIMPIDLVSNKIMECNLHGKKVFKGRIGLDPQVKVGNKGMHGFKFHNKKTRRMNTVYATSCIITDYNLL